MTQPTDNQRRSHRAYDLPLSLEIEVEISGPFPLTPVEWERLQHLLDTMKPGLVRYGEPPVKDQA